MAIDMKADDLTESLSPNAVKAIFDSLHKGKPPPPGINFRIVPVENGNKIAPPFHAFNVGIYVLLRPHKSKTKTKEKEKVQPPTIPPHLAHLKMDIHPLTHCPWKCSGAQNPRGPNIIQHRYCYPDGNDEYASTTGGSVYTMFTDEGKEDFEFRLLHVHYSTKRRKNASKRKSIDANDGVQKAAKQRKRKASKQTELDETRPDSPISGVEPSPTIVSDTLDHINDLLDPSLDFYANFPDPNDAYGALSDLNEEFSVLLGVDLLDPSSPTYQDTNDSIWSSSISSPGTDIVVLESNIKPYDSPSNRQVLEGSVADPPARCKARRKWTEQEDGILLRAMANAETANFNDILKLLPGRTRQQLHHRWSHYLDPKLKFLPFTRSDDLLLWEARQKLKMRWTDISTKTFNSTKSQNQVKNRWHSNDFKAFIRSKFGHDAVPDAPKRKSSTRLQATESAKTKAGDDAASDVPNSTPSDVNVYDEFAKRLVFVGNTIYNKWIGSRPRTERERLLNIAAAWGRWFSKSICESGIPEPGGGGQRRQGHAMVRNEEDDSSVYAV